MKKQKGFSIFGLLVKISLVGIIIALSFIFYSQNKKGSRDEKRKSDLEQIKSVLEIYKTDCKAYPTILGASLTGMEDSCLGNKYLIWVPTDPVISNVQYQYFSDGTKYVIFAKLESSTTDYWEVCSDERVGKVTDANIPTNSTCTLP